MDRIEADAGWLSKIKTRANNQPFSGRFTDNLSHTRERFFYDCVCSFSTELKPCNIAQSEEHNKRDEEYIKALNPANIYIRKDLICQNTTYVPPDLKGTSLQEYYDSLKAMVKAKTGRAMQEKDEAEKKAQAAKTELSSAESKVTEKQSEIDKLDQRITAKEAMLDGLVTETAALRKEKYSDRSDGCDGWKDSLLACMAGQHTT